MAPASQFDSLQAHVSEGIDRSFWECELVARGYLRSSTDETDPAHRDLSRLSETAPGPPKGASSLWNSFSE